MEAAKQPRELFKESAIELKWKNIQRTGAGLQNLGNTCFMNAALQCLIHTPPLVEALLGPAGHVPSHGGGQFDPLTMTQHLIRKAYSGTSLVSPVAHATNLKMLNKRFRLGRQEDSHEFLRCLLDSMHEAAIKRYQPKPSPEIALTSLIYRVFGGKLRSQIRCDGVDYQSSKVDPFLDLSLDVSHASSVRRALQHFTSPEVLDGENKYRCPTNGKLVRAVKQITIHEPPNVLTLHLKRFEFGFSASKISKRVDFDLELDLAPFMSSLGPTGKGQPQGTGHIYDLYAVLVHHGHSVHSGHYLSYVRNSSGMWQQCDDTRVAQVSERQVLGQQAYILFYIRRFPRTASPAISATAPALSAPSITIPLPSSVRQQQLSRSKNMDDSQPLPPTAPSDHTHEKNKTILIPALTSSAAWLKEALSNTLSSKVCPSPLRLPTTFQRFFSNNFVNGMGKKMYSLYQCQRAMMKVKARSTSAARSSLTDSADEELDLPPPKIAVPAPATALAPASAGVIEKKEAKKAKEVVKVEIKPAASQAFTSASSDDEPSTEVIHTGADAVRMLGGSSNPYRVGSLNKVDPWADADEVNPAPSFSSRSLHGGSNKRPERDEYDEEYDRGKLKKVKSTEPRRGHDLHVDGNAFQEEWRVRQGGRGGGRGGSPRGGDRDRSMSREGGRGRDRGDRGRGRSMSRGGGRGRGDRPSFSGGERGGRSEGFGRGGFRGGGPGRFGGRGEGRGGRGRGRGGGRGFGRSRGRF